MSSAADAKTWKKSGADNITGLLHFHPGLSSTTSTSLNSTQPSYSTLSAGALELLITFSN